MEIKFIPHETKMEHGKSLVEVEETILFEVHCNTCNDMLGYYIETEKNNETCIISVKCWKCRKKELKK